MTEPKEVVKAQIAKKPFHEGLTIFVAFSFVPVVIGICVFIGCKLLGFL